MPTRQPFSPTERRHIVPTYRFTLESLKRADEAIRPRQARKNNPAAPSPADATNFLRPARRPEVVGVGSGRRHE